MSMIASQITSLTIVYSTVYSDADQRKHQSSASLAFVRGIHRGPVNSPHKWPVTRKMFPFHDVIMELVLSFIHILISVKPYWKGQDIVQSVSLTLFYGKQNRVSLPIPIYVHTSVRVNGLGHHCLKLLCVAHSVPRQIRNHVHHIVYMAQ